MRGRKRHRQIVLVRVDVPAERHDRLRSTSSWNANGSGESGVVQFESPVHARDEKLVLSDTLEVGEGGRGGEDRGGRFMGTRFAEVEAEEGLECCWDGRETAQRTIG